MMHLKRITLPAGFAALAISQAAARPAAPVPVARNGEKPRNVIFILSDDHRYDFMGCRPRRSTAWPAKAPA